MVPSTAAHFGVELCTSVQRPCIRFALGRAASEGTSVIWSADLMWYNNRAAAFSTDCDDVIGMLEGQCGVSVVQSMESTRVTTVTGTWLAINLHRAADVT